MVLILGLTGSRGVGKSRLCDALVEGHGFTRMHPFDGGKAACEAYFRHLGATAEEASRMVRGDLKDASSPFLPMGPDGQRHAPRYFMERFGAFMGVTLGSEWTLEAEVARLIGAGVTRIVSESIVFEADDFRRLGGVIVEVVRTGGPMIEGIETDRAVRRISPDAVFHNMSDTVEQAQSDFVAFIEDRLHLWAPAELLPEPFA